MGRNHKEVVRRTLPWALRWCPRSRLLAKLWFKYTRFNQRITIAYISLDEPELIEVAHDYCQRFGISIRVFLDSRTEPLNVRRLESAGLSVNLVPNHKDYAEGLYAGIAELTTTEWLLLITNDELLSLRSLIEMAALTSSVDDTSCFGISRQWLLPIDGSLKVAKSDFMNFDYQFRLVRPQSVSFHDEIHTPGFDLPANVKLLEPDACMYHFDWLLRPLEARRAKLDFYERRLPGARERYRKWYLPEEHMEDFDFLTLEDRSLTPCAERYQEICSR